MLTWGEMVNIKPYEHQTEEAAKMYQRAIGYANFGEMGTGKTLAAIMAANALVTRQSVSKALVVCPVSLKYNWKNEVEKHSSVKWDVKVLEGSSTKRMEQIDKIMNAEASNPQLLIVNYDSLPRLYKHLKKFDPELVIADECHAIKSPRIKRTKALKAIKSKYKFAMTGTPLVCSPLDMWSVFDWLRPNHLQGNFYAFRNRYCVMYTGAGFPMVTSYKNLDELKEKVDAFSCRRLKSECLDLPEKSFTEIKVDMTAHERRAYNDMALHLIAEVDAEKDPVVASTILTKLLRLQQITGGTVTDGDRTLEIAGDHSKISALKDLLESLEDQKVVVFARFTAEVEMIRRLCVKMDRKRHVMIGDTKEKDRQSLVEEFQISNGSNDIIIANVQVGGLGITLTESSHCIYFSNTWSLGDRLQSQDRLHRIGQQNRVTYYDIVANGTIDEYILKVLNKKAMLSDKVTGDDLRKMVFMVDK